MMHAKSDSDVTSLAASSPPRSPKRGAVYYVQSPSRDSHDEDKSSSMQPTPVLNSPMDSPSHHSLGRHSRTSSGSRFSGTLRSWSGRKGSSHHRGGKRNDKGWPECDVILEEGNYEELDNEREMTRRCQILMGFMVFVLFFTSLCLIIWGATKTYKPNIHVRRLAIDDFYAGQGTDHTGVPTKLITLNCSLKLSIYNSAPTFGIHVRSSPINIIFSEITVATGQLEKYYQPKKSRRIRTVVLQGEKVPLYGAGATLEWTATGGKVPVVLDFDIVTRGYVVGKLVKTTHRKHVSCALTLDSSETKPIRFPKSNCTYT